MNKVVCYVDCEEKLTKLKKYIGKFFFKADLIRANNSYIILINTNELNDKNFKKLNKILLKNNINTVALSKKYQDKSMIFKERGFQILDGKIIMKFLIKEILSYIFSVRNQQMYENELYITTESDKHIDIILDMATEFKNLNIVTDKIKKLKILDKKLEKKSDIVYSISNNKTKSLQRASIIVNFDYDEDIFNKFKIKRNSTIVNLYSKPLNLKHGFQGTIIENISIDYNNQFFKDNNLINFSSSILYESTILEMNYNQIKNRLTNDKCKIKHLLGKNGFISINELKYNYS